MDASESKPSWWKVIFSMCCAFFGVQTSKNHQSDFSSLSFWRYLVVGTVLVVVFVFSLVAAVQLILYFADI